KSAGQRPDQPRPHLVEMGRAGRGRSRRWAPCASCLLGRRYDPIRRGGNLRVRQRGRGPVAREGWRPVSAPHKLGRSSDEAMLVLQMSSKRGQSSEDSMESDVNACRLQLLITQRVYWCQCCIWSWRGPGHLLQEANGHLQPQERITGVLPAVSI
uniref:Uncharacterized protein n=1 Tax=Aegilops tauschii subsp. strangulata TaxID=200361 RepID=A0A453KGF8_AEGTS